MFPATTAGKVRFSPATSTAPSGTSAILSRASFTRPFARVSIRRTSWGSRTTFTPSARATPSIVTSSCVGPTPPDVKTMSNVRLCSVTSEAIRSTSSGITEIFRTSTPSMRSSRQRYEAFASTTLPERISLPIRMIPAVLDIDTAMVARTSAAPVRGMLEWREHDREVGTKESAMSADASPIKLSGWALILGASSGFGAATGLALARAGCHIFGVHLDRKATLPNAQRVVADIQALGREARFWNVNAADEEKRKEVVGEM